jgi:hypothetical protein
LGLEILTDYFFIFINVILKGKIFLVSIGLELDLSNNLMPNQLNIVVTNENKAAIVLTIFEISNNS